MCAMATIFNINSRTTVYDIRPEFTSYELETLNVDTDSSSNNPDTVIVFNQDRTMVKFLWPGSSIEMLIGDDIQTSDYETQEYTDLLRALVVQFSECYSKIVGAKFDFTDSTKLNFYDVLRLFAVYNVWYHTLDNCANKYCDLLYTVMGLTSEHTNELNMITKKANMLYRIFLIKCDTDRNEQLKQFMM